MGTASTEQGSNPAGPADPAAAAAAGQGTTDERLDRIERTVASLATSVNNLVSSGQAAESQVHGAAERHEAKKLDRNSEVAAEVQAAIRDHDAQQQAERRASGLQRKVDDLSGQVKAITEKKPREYRRVERFMGWASKGDET